jgi:hypothetical protein
MRQLGPSVVFLILLGSPCLTLGTQTQPSKQLDYPTVTLSLSSVSVTINVGESAVVNITATAAESPLPPQICFSVTGFPTSGFVTTFQPPCARFHSSRATSVLTIEATPAAAPQNFTSLVVARFNNQTVQADLQVIVVPAISPWIPWSLVLAFVAFFAITLFWAPKRREKKRSKKRPYARKRKKASEVAKR